MNAPLPSLIAAVLTLWAAIPAAAEGDSARGANVFRQCVACHTTTLQNRIGPGLADIVGRKAGANAGFRYSAGMQKVDLVWDVPTLDAYLAAPRAVVPASTMSLAVTNPQEREDLIAYLQTLRSVPAN
ncbi:MAG: c-type cytochrome [Beijerinckiaceae bacterium]|nr:c-type cytochrome [Beijerinckiaceae bacterium]